MEDKKLNQLFKQADLELNRAREELYHPSGDVVNYSVCVFARSSLHRFLTCLYEVHARKNSEPVETLQTLDQLISAVKRYTHKLDEVDLSGLGCSNRNVLNQDDVYYCNNVDKVKYCADIAERVKELVVEQLSVS